MISRREFVIASGVAVAAFSLCAQGVDNWPTCNPVNVYGVPCYSGINVTNGAAFPFAPAEYCPSMTVSVAVGAAILLLAPGWWKVSAIIPVLFTLFFPTCTDTGCPGTSD